MKLIIDIPDYIYKICQDHRDIVYQYIAHGTPLDNIKAEIKKECDIEAQNHDTFDDYSDGRYDAFSACLKIIDKYMRGKAESEE